MVDFADIQNLSGFKELSDEDQKDLREAYLNIFSDGYDYSSRNDQYIRDDENLEFQEEVPEISIENAVESIKKNIAEILKIMKKFEARG